MNMIDILILICGILSIIALICSIKVKQTMLVGLGSAIAMFILYFSTLS